MSLANSSSLIYSLVYTTLILLIISLSACKKESTEANDDTVLLNYEPQKDTVEQVRLTQNAANKIKEIPEYRALQQSLDSLFIASSIPYSEQVAELMNRTQDFKELLPEKLRINTINGRLNVLLTEIGQMQQSFTDRVITEQFMYDQKKKITRAFNNLNIQINEVYLEIPENIAKELLQETEELADSIPVDVPIYN